MFDSKNHYTQLKRNNYKGDPDKSLPDCRYIIKTKSTDQKPYLIYIEEFSSNYMFIKFHPSRYTSDENKYKLRIGNKTLPIKIISTCVEVVAEKAKQHPNVTFGIYGQWDDLDVKKSSETSQRYQIWKTIAMRKFGSEKYTLVSMSHLNIVLMIPKEKYSDEFLLKTHNYFSKRFKNKLDELKVPTLKELATFS